MKWILCIIYKTKICIRNMYSVPGTLTRWMMARNSITQDSKIIIWSSHWNRQTFETFDRNRHNGELGRMQNILDKQIPWYFLLFQFYCIRNIFERSVVVNIISQFAIVPNVSLGLIKKLVLHELKKLSGERENKLYTY